MCNSLEIVFLPPRTNHPKTPHVGKIQTLVSIAVSSRRMAHVYCLSRSVSSLRFCHCSFPGTLTLPACACKSTLTTTEGSACHVLRFHVLCFKLGTPTNFVSVLKRYRTSAVFALGPTSKPQIPHPSRVPAV